MDSELTMEHSAHILTLHDGKRKVRITMLKDGDRLYIAGIFGSPSRKISEIAQTELDKAAKKLGCKIATADVIKNPKLLELARKAGFRFSPRALFGLKHAPIIYSAGFGKRGTVPMHKKIPRQ